MIEPTSDNIQPFIDRWAASGAAERANYQLFLSELCDLLDVPRPDPKTPLEEENAYVFEKSVPKPQGTVGSIDLYKRGCFVLEAKQGSDQVDRQTSDTLTIKIARIQGLLETLADLGQVVEREDGLFTAV